LEQPSYNVRAATIIMHTVYNRRDAGKLLHCVLVQTSVNTNTADDGYDEASQCDVIATHPGHRLLSIRYS